VTPHGAETLTEVTDVTEVDRLAGLCQQQRPGSVTASFRHVLAQAGKRTNSDSQVLDPRARELAGGGRRIA
jgi:hypothetical protein